MADTRFELGNFSMGKIEIDLMSVRAAGAPEYPLLMIPATLSLKEIRLTELKSGARAIR
jgi:hypothetical protein